MASLQRTIRRKIMFKGMNKIQRALWSDSHGNKNRKSTMNLGDAYSVARIGRKYRKC